MLPDWLRTYRADWLPQDAMAGVIVAIMLVPQAMGYALIAGVPPEVGLYASILPLLLYALIGSSRVLAVGPVALVSLLVAAATSELSEGDPARAVALAAILAAGVGILQIAMGLLRAGFVVNFLGHPVIAGFTSAAAIVIAASQLKHILGLQVPRTDAPYAMFVAIGRRLGETHGPTVALGASALAALIGFRVVLAPLLRKHAQGALVELVVRSGPLVVLVAGTLVSTAFGLSDMGVQVVGAVPQGLPRFSLPEMDKQLVTLLPAIVTIALVGFLESYAVAHALAARRRERVDANRELVGLGMANLGAAVSGGIPVAGGFSRSVVNANAGARTGLASIITAALVAATVLFLTPLLNHLPMAALAAVIVVAVSSLIDVPDIVRTWQYGRSDGLSLAATFVSVLAIGVEGGIAVGAGLSMLLLVARSTRPHIAIIGRIPGSEHFRNILRHDVEQVPRLLILRMDESLHFGNTRALEQAILHGVAERPDCCHVLLVCSAINLVDSSGLSCLRDCRQNLRSAGISMSLAEVKGPVADKLEEQGFLEELGAECFFLSTDTAVRALVNRECTNEVAST